MAFNSPTIGILAAGVVAITPTLPQSKNFISYGPLTKGTWPSRIGDENPDTVGALALIDNESIRFNSVSEKLDALAEKWAEYNSGRSVTDYHHAAYMQIIGIGPPVVPLLLERLASGEGQWIIALKYITGAKVTTPDMRGDFRRIQQAWAEWGEQNAGTQLRR